MNEEDQKILENLGWTREQIDIAKGGSALDSVDKWFLDRAHNALQQTGCSALDFLRGNQGVSVLELAKRLNRGVSALGLIMAIYEEAVSSGVLRATAMELLLRKIHQEFPDGWTTHENLSASVMIGDWDYEIMKYVHDSQTTECATKILKHLTIDYPPPEGWKPKLVDDPLLDDLFDRYWPVEPLSGNTGEIGVH